MRGNSCWLLCTGMLLVLQVSCAPVATYPPPEVPDFSELSESPSSDQVDRESLQNQLAIRNSEVAQLRLKLLEKQAEVNQLSAAHEEAMREIVRTNAKLHSRDTRADTLARIAEASLEIEQAAERVGEEHHHRIELAKNLLQSSRSQLEKDNYSAASFLADKASRTVGKLQVAENSYIADSDETPFAMPLDMEARIPSNVRVKPQAGSKILFQLEKGQRVSAYGYSGSWLRIISQDEREGWIYYYLLELPKN